MAGFKTKIFYSTTTGGATEDGFKKGDEIAEQIADFILTLLPSGYTKETVEQTYTKSDVTYNYKGFKIGKENGDIKWTLRCYDNSSSAGYRLYLNEQNISGTAAGSSKCCDFQATSSSSQSGAASIKLSYIIGKNGSVAIKFGDYNASSYWNGNFDFLLVPATVPNTSTTAEFMCVTYSDKNSLYAASEVSAAYNEFKSTSINTGILSFSGGNYDLIVPMPVPNTEYLSDDLYVCTNSDATPNKVIEYNGGKYATITTGDTTIAMQIE